MGKEIFQRAEALLGTEALERIGKQRVIIFGTGGVGSWCAEALVRTGVCQMTIVDFDCVDVTNINRQLMATTQTVGQPKVEVLRERLLAMRLFSSMGAALKLDPTKIQVAEFWKVKGDPLARALRNRFRKAQQKPQRKFQCVFSEESPSSLLVPPSSPKGSLVHITAIFGMTLAGLVVQDIRSKD